MISKQLGKIKKRLDEKLYLSNVEKELLNELNDIETLSESIDFSEKRGEVLKALGGPGDSCPCCGRGM